MSGPRNLVLNASAILLMVLATVDRAYAHQGHHKAKGDASQPTQEAKSAPQNSALDAAIQQIQADYARDIRPIFDQKCAACHSSSIPAPWYASIPGIGRIVESDRSEAKEHLEISKGFPFAGHGTPDEDLEAIEASVVKGTMPTRLYRFAHPSSALTEQERAAIVIWVETGRARLKAAAPK